MKLAWLYISRRVFLFLTISFFLVILRVTKTCTSIIYFQLDFEMIKLFYKTPVKFSFANYENVEISFDLFFVPIFFFSSGTAAVF